VSYPFHYDQPDVAPFQASELIIQASCKLRVEDRFDAIFAAVPNGTNIRSYAGRTKVKKEGLHKGFPDAVIVGMGLNAGMVAFYECKAKGSLRPDQIATLTTLHNNGHDCGVFRSQDTLASWLISKGWQ
jgi:hypothetical protein